MVKHSSRNLSGVALDWAVARAEKMQVFVDDEKLGKVVREMGVDGEPVFRPRQDWAFVGGIIVRERIVLIPTKTGWFTSMFNVEDEHGLARPVDIQGDDPLTAVLRCLVFSKLGDVVEIPVELAAVENGAFWYSELPRIGSQAATNLAAS